MPIVAARTVRRVFRFQLDLFAWRRPPAIVAPTPAPRGIDIKASAAEIRRIILAKFNVPRLERDDLVQEVLLRIYVRNGLPCAYDPAKAALSTYVYRVTKNVIGHMLNAPRWKRLASEGDGEDVEELFAEQGDAVEAAETAGVDLQATRELGEIVPRRPRQVWELALEQRQAEARASADDVPGGDAVADEDQLPAARGHRARGRAVDRVRARARDGHGRGARGRVLEGDPHAVVEGMIIE